MHAVGLDGFSLCLTGDVLRLIPLREAQLRSWDVKARRPPSRIERFYCKRGARGAPRPTCVGWQAW